MERYFFSFKDYNGHTIRVDMYDTASENSAEFELSGTSEPVIIEQTEDDDPMCPLRYTYARIKIAGSYHALMSLNGYNIRVVIRQDGDVIWTGRLEPQAFSQELDDRLDEIELNAIDDLGYAATKEIQLNDNDGTIRLIDIIDQALQHGRELEGDDKILYIGNKFPYTISIPYTMEMFTVASNWQEKGDDGIVRGKKLESALTDWMRIMGCTMESNGKDWYIRTPDDTLYICGAVTRTKETLMQFGIEAKSIDYKDVSELSSSGANSIDVVIPYGSASVKSGGGDTQDIMPHIARENFDSVYYGPFNGRNHDHKKIGWYGALLSAKQDSGITLHRYNIDATNIDNLVWEPTDMPRIDYNYSNPLLGASGAVFLYHDYYDTGDKTDQDKGTGETTKGKVNWDMSERLFLIQTDKEYHDRITKYIPFLEDFAAKRRQWVSKFPAQVSLRSTQPVFTTNGGLCITMKVFGTRWREYDTELPGPIRLNKNVCKYIAMRIRLGDYALTQDDATGELKWMLNATAEKSLIFAKVEDTDTGNFKSLKSTKTLAMNFRGDGLCIPISSAYYADGRIEVDIVCAITESGRELILCPLVFIEGIDIKLAVEETKETIVNELKNTKTITEQGDEGIEAYSIDTSLSTGDDILQSSGTIYLPSRRRVIDQLTIGGTTGTAEKLALTKAKRWMLNKSIIYTLNHEGDPCDAISNTLYGTASRLAIVSQDLRRATSQVKYIVIPS